MYDNLRDEVNPFEDKEDATFRSTSNTISGPITRRSSRFLGMTSLQRFVIAVLMMGAVFVLGAMCLFVTGKIGF